MVETVLAGLLSKPNEPRFLELDQFPGNFTADPLENPDWMCGKTVSVGRSHNTFVALAHGQHGSVIGEP